MSAFLHLGKSCPVCHGKGKKCQQSHSPDYATPLIHCHGAHEYDADPAYIYLGTTSASFRLFVLEDGQPHRPIQGKRSPQSPVAPSTPFDPYRIKTARGESYTVCQWIERNCRFPSPAFFTENLGLLPCAVHALSWMATVDTLGYDCWTTPEYGLRDDDLVVVARHLRYPDARKRSHGNDLLPPEILKRGVFPGTDWFRKAGAVLLPEGASNTTALGMLGLPAIGRPNNGPLGVETVAWLLRHFRPGDHDALVLADYDRKPDGSFPGRDGGLQAVQSLADLLGQPVLFGFAPDGAKDAREWAKSHLHDAEPAALGQRFLDGVLSQAQVILPGSPVSIQAGCKLPSAPVPCHGGDGAALLPGPARDLSDLEAPGSYLGHQPEQPLPLEVAGTAYHRRQLNDPDHPCTRPQHVICLHQANWNPLEVEKRCAQCQGCIQHAIELNLTILRAFWLAALAQGAQLYERCFHVREWAGIRKAYNDAPDFPGKGYNRFLAADQPDHFYLVTTVASLGSPVDIEGALTEARMHVAAAVRANAGTRRPVYSSSRSWQKERLPRPEKQFAFHCSTDPIDDADRREINTGVGCQERVSEVPGHPTIIRTRLHVMPGGWTHEQLQRWLDSRLMGFLVPEPAAYASHADPDPFAATETLATTQ